MTTTEALNETTVPDSADKHIIVAKSQRGAANGSQTVFVGFLQNMPVKTTLAKQ